MPETHLQYGATMSLLLLLWTYVWQQILQYSRISTILSLLSLDVKSRKKMCDHHCGNLLHCSYIFCICKKNTELERHIAMWPVDEIHHLQLHLTSFVYQSAQNTAYVQHSPCYTVLQATSFVGHQPEIHNHPWTCSSIKHHLTAHHCTWFKIIYSLLDTWFSNHWQINC